VIRARGQDSICDLTGLRTNKGVSIFWLAFLAAATWITD